MQYLLLIISIVLFAAAPSNAYSFSICLYAFCIFLAGALLSIYKLRKVEFFGFNLLFTISFFGCCYIFPLFIYNIDDSFSLFHHGYDYKVITKATCLASLAYSCYACGLLQNLPKLVYYKKIHPDKKIRIMDLNIHPNSVFNTAILFFVLFIIAGGYNYLDNQYANNVAEGGIITYFYVLVTLIPVLLAYTLNCKFRKKYIIGAGIFTMLLLLTGSRTHPLAVLLGGFYVYNTRHKIPSYIIVLLLFLGVIFMAFIGATRGGQELEADSTVGYWSAFLDLIVNNRNLFDAYSIVQSTNIAPTVLIGPILAAIPMGQSLFCMLTGTPDYLMRSSAYITYEHFGADPPLGLGTNIVGDVYIGGGLLAIFILFYLLGYLITKALHKIHINQNLNWYIFYLCLVTSGIFICRGSFFLFFRPFIWTLAILFSIKTLTIRIK